MTNFAWHFRKPDVPQPLRLSIPSRIELFRQAKRNHLVKHSRARSKQDKDQDRLARHLEKTRILQEAHYDTVSSIGEVDALTDSHVLDINRAEVLRDPKLRYIHPSLRE